MKAAEARQLAAQANRASGKAIAPLLEYAHKRIREAAEKGESSVWNPLFNCHRDEGRRRPLIEYTAEQERQVCHLLREEGYDVKLHRGNPLDQRESDWWEVSW